MAFGQGVMEHAIKNYEKKGWDVIVECYTVEELDQATKTAKTLKGAIRVAYKALVKMRYEYEQDIRGWGGLNDEEN